MGKQKLHRIVREFNTSADSIQKILKSHGIKISNDLNETIDEKMLDILRNELDDNDDKNTPIANPFSFANTPESIFPSPLTNNPFDQQSTTIEEKYSDKESVKTHQSIKSKPQTPTKKEQKPKKKDFSTPDKVKLPDIKDNSTKKELNERKKREEKAKNYSEKHEKVITPEATTKIDNELKPKRPTKKIRKTTRRIYIGKKTEKSEHSIGIKKISKTGKFKHHKLFPTIDPKNVDKTVKSTLRKATHKRIGKRKDRNQTNIKELQNEVKETTKEIKTIELTKTLSVHDLATHIKIDPSKIITLCMNLGLKVTMNQRVEEETIELICNEYNFKPKFMDVEIHHFDMEEQNNTKNLKSRPPVITIMGHVDHGKTSLMDHIRRSNVVAGEAGGITQHIGAYVVNVKNNQSITFLDTPGHESFTAMRSRGVQVTDIVILLIAADSGIMPQTIEAIHHAQAAGVPIVVAINKIDKAEANPTLVKQQLSEHNIMIEEYGGKVQVAEISAKMGKGIDDLLDKILLEAELLELKADPSKNAVGVILESKLDKGKGVTVDILIYEGTLRLGDYFVAGTTIGKVRSMEDEYHKKIKIATPSTPVQITGFDQMPQTGDKLHVMKTEKQAKKIATERNEILYKQNIRKQKHLSLQELSNRIAQGNKQINELLLIIKADVEGSLEALIESLQKLSSSEVILKVIHSAIGAITESDVMLAHASNAIIIGFQVRPTMKARKMAENENIDIQLFKVIYHVVEEVQRAMEGLLSPEENEISTGIADVRQLFPISKMGTVLGCYLKDGKIKRTQKVRILREGKVIHEGNIASLKRIKDDVNEVNQGYEFGILIDKYNDVKVADELEFFEIEYKKQKLKDTAKDYA